MKYNIYAGLGGGFGGATYQGTGDFEYREAAEQAAYEAAVEEYEMQEGLHGIRSRTDIADEEGLDYEEDENEINEMYNDEKESWMEYYAVLTEEDDLEDEEITGL